MDNVANARALRDTLLSEGPEAAARFFHPEVTINVAVGYFEGLNGMAQWFREISKYLIDYEIAGAEFTDAGDAVIVNNMMRARGGRTPLATQDQIYLLRFQEGRVIRVTRHASKEDALAVAGVERSG